MRPAWIAGKKSCSVNKIDERMDTLLRKALKHYLLPVTALLLASIGSSLAISHQASDSRPVQLTGDVRRTSHDLDRLFSEEMKMASVKLKWHGERLTEDTIYAVALTGASWESAWGKETMFSLAWGDIKKVQQLAHHSARSRETAIVEINSLYQAKQYRKVVNTAGASFSQDEIGCDQNLKEYVGSSQMALGQPEQAFPIFAAPFESPSSEPKSSEHNRRFRLAALEAAISAGLKKEAVAFSLSLLLDPDADAPKPDQKQIEYLERSGVDIDRVMLGIMQAPEKLRGLPSYYYAAADMLAYRASPRLFPFLLQLADSSDVYLRGRAIVGLGIVAHQVRPSDGQNWWDRMVYGTPREFGISSGERKLVDREIKEGASSDKYRLRTAAALAMGLIGDTDYLPLLQKLTKDKAYVLINDVQEKSKARNIMYPVRMAAAASLARFGTIFDAGGGQLSGKDLDKAKRGGSDETNDHRNLRKDVASILTITPLDITLNVPYR